MNLENFTPFTPATFVSAKEKDGNGYVMTVLVKAVFAMRHGEIAQPLDQQLFPLGDTYPEGADPETSSLAYASDFVPYKLRADVLLSATAYRPSDQPTGTFHVAFRVGNLVKRLAVSGQREFQPGIVSASIVERKPLASIPVAYENAFGGPKFALNPVGRGHKSNELPSIEYIDQQLQSPGQKPAPAGFGPIAADWEPRKSMVGTVGHDYLEKHWPGFPANFDASYFNAAPADQQVVGHLRGDEKVVLENLHPAQPLFATRLPAFRVVCLRENEEGRCELIPLVIDTLWINPDADQLVLVWRGRTSIQTPDALEIKRLGFLVDELASPAQEAAWYQKRLQALIDERDAEFEPEPPPAEEASKVVTKPSNTPEAADDELRTIQAELVAVRVNAGLSPEEEVVPTEPPPLSPESQAKFEEIMANIEDEDRRQAEEDEAGKWTREKVIAAVKENRPLADAELSGLDLSDCDFTEADFRGAKLDGVNFARSSLTRAVLTGCSMAGAKLDSAKVDEANLDGANLQGGTLTKATMIAAQLVAVDLTDAVLDGADLSAVAAEQAIFNGASLAAAMFSKANLTGAVLSGVKGPKADFGAAILVGAACDHADFSGANFQKADLSDADFTASNLNDANLSGVRAVDANFTQAELMRASFQSANCDGMWLSSALADGANFQGASCVDLQFDGTSAKQANFSDCCITSIRGGQRANLAGASFRQRPHGSEPIFESCLLEGADFSQANIPGANFIHASVARSDFTAADLNGARFDYANCQGALFVSANLFQAIFAGVNLIDADISQGNFYGVEFLDARISKLRYKNCNLHMTKLERWATTKNQ